LHTIGKLRDSTFFWLGLLVSAVSSLLKSRAAVQLEKLRYGANSLFCNAP
jgi:hypothetical protein